MERSIASSSYDVLSTRLDVIQFRDLLPTYRGYLPIPPINPGIPAFSVLADEQLTILTSAPGTVPAPLAGLRLADLLDEPRHFNAVRSIIKALKGNIITKKPNYAAARDAMLPLLRLPIPRQGRLAALLASLANTLYNISVLAVDSEIALQCVQMEVKARLASAPVYYADLAAASIDAINECAHAARPSSIAENVLAVATALPVKLARQVVVHALGVPGAPVASLAPAAAGLASRVQELVAYQMVIDDSAGAGAGAGVDEEELAARRRRASFVYSPDRVGDDVRDVDTLLGANTEEKRLYALETCRDLAKALEGPKGQGIRAEVVLGVIALLAVGPTPCEAREELLRENELLYVQRSTVGDAAEAVIQAVSQGAGETRALSKSMKMACASVGTRTLLSKVNEVSQMTATQAELAMKQALEQLENEDINLD